MFSSITILKRYCKCASKKSSMMTEKFYLYDRFFMSNWNFTHLHVKILKGFIVIFVQNSMFFQITGFLVTVHIITVI